MVKYVMLTTSNYFLSLWNEKILKECLPQFIEQVLKTGSVVKFKEILLFPKLKVNFKDFDNEYFVEFVQNIISKRTENGIERQVQ